MRQSYRLRIVLADANGDLPQQLELFALVNLGLVQSLASGVLSATEAVQHFYNADNCWVYFLAVFAASPRCICTNSKYGARIGANQSGVTRGEPTRRRNFPRSSVSRKILTEALRTRERLALVFAARRATYCRTESVSVASKDRPRSSRCREKRSHS